MDASLATTLLCASRIYTSSVFSYIALHLFENNRIWALDKLRLRTDFSSVGGQDILGIQAHLHRLLNAAIPICIVTPVRRRGGFWHYEMRGLRKDALLTHTVHSTSSKPVARGQHVARDTVVFHAEKFEMGKGTFKLLPRKAETQNRKTNS
jgi:hypothetical protein